VDALQVAQDSQANVTSVALVSSNFAQKVEVTISGVVLHTPDQSLSIDKLPRCTDVAAQKNRKPRFQALDDVSV
jgi:hypothetical protein